MNHSSIVQKKTLPQEFIARLQRIIPKARFSQVLESFAGEKNVVARINTLQVSIEHAEHVFKGEGFTPSIFSSIPNALRFPFVERSRLMETALYKARAVYFQNPSSMLSPHILDPQPGEEILDLTAAPGSKTLQMACMMGDEGRIAAVERSKTRFFKLKANIAENNIHCVRCYRADGRYLWRKVPERFDRVLLDAPCSSESRFRVGNEKSYQYWSVKKIKEMVRLQKQLVFTAFHCLKPGGVLVYSTCSFAPEENEAVIDWILTKFASLLTVERIELHEPHCQSGLTDWEGKCYTSEVSRALRVLPDEVYDGFFICKLRKVKGNVI